MLDAIFHAWERRLAAVTTDRVVRPFEWGTEWLPQNGHGPDTPADARVSGWVDQIVADSDAFYAAAPTADYVLERGQHGGRLMFPSALTTPHAENDTVYCRYFPAPSKRAAVVV